jgi:glycosyltransferase involved in cell wall biosynthesis
MRITIILGPFMPVPPVLGGAVEKVHLLLASAYRKAGHDVTIMSRRYKAFPNTETIDGVTHVRIPSFRRFSFLPINLVSDFFYALVASFRLPRSDVTITNSFFLPLLLRRRTAGKIYVHVARYPKHQMRLYARADRLQAISKAVADAIVRQAPELSSKVVTIGYPVPDRYFQDGQVQPRHRTILFVGRIAREKGIDLLIKAFAALRRESGFPAWKLRIVGPHDVTQGGDGAGYYNELLELARPLGAEYRNAAIFVYPSLAETGEAFGLAPLEAMAAGCAVVVSDLRCFDDFIVHDVSGLKFDHRDHPENGLASQLAKLMSNATLADTIAAAGRASAENFRTSEIAGKMLDDFRIVLTDPAP